MSGIWQVDTIVNSAGTGAPAFTYGIQGSTTGTAPAAGIVGQVVTAINSAGSNAGSTGAYAQITTISLTAGNWVIFGHAEACNGGSTTVSTSANNGVVISTTTASGSGGIETYNFCQFYGNTNASSGGVGSRFGAADPKFVVSISGTTSYYLNGVITYTGTVPTWEGTLIAVRIG